MTDKLTRDDLDQLRLEMQAMPSAVAEIVQRVLDHRDRLREALYDILRDGLGDGAAAHAAELLKEGEE